MIRVSGLSKFYGRRRAIDDVTFSIAPGEIVGLLGPNGAGKSTILKVLGCFLVPSCGEAWVDGIPVEDDPAAIRRVIGYLPDTPPLYNEMTVEGYLTYIARIKDVPAGEIAAKVERVLDKVSLTGERYTRCGELSHGFRQRVSIAQAMVHEPKVLILDEPITGLDPIQIKEMRDLILSLRGKQTVILSSHILSEITKTCDRIIVIDAGRVVAQGREADLDPRAGGAMQVLCDLQAFVPGVMEAIRAITGVSRVDSAPNADMTHRLVIETQRDVRPALASAIHKAGGAMLAFHRKDEGLESVFMKLVGNNNDNRPEGGR
jgi:ABC-2 type transport system ATP-binding protein